MVTGFGHLGAMAGTQDAGGWAEWRLISPYCAVLAKVRASDSCDFGLPTRQPRGQEEQVHYGEDYRKAGGVHKSGTGTKD